MSGAGRVRVGPAGWSYRDWEGIVYPARAGSSFDQLAWIADWFDLVEINVSFYRIPDPATARHWTRRVSHNPSFRFAAKLHRSLTHETQAPEGTLEAWKQFVAPLAEAGLLAAALVQFPWSFRNDQRAHEFVAALVTDLAPLPVAVEVRHGGFADDGTWRDLLRRLGAAWVSIDQPLISNGLPPIDESTADFSYVRMHGRNHEKWFAAGQPWERYDYLYSPSELQPWAGRIEAMAGRGDVLVVMNNHWRGQAVVNAVEMRRRLGQTSDAPPPLAMAYPDRFPGATLFPAE